MKIIFPKSNADIVITRSTKKGIKREVEKKLKQQLGRHLSTLQAIAIKNPTNPNIHGYAIYTEEKKKQNPQIIFHDMIQWETNYFFGIVETIRSHKRFFFLADIRNPLPIGKEKILLQGVKEIKVFIKQ